MVENIRQMISSALENVSELRLILPYLDALFNVAYEFEIEHSERRAAVFNEWLQIRIGEDEYLSPDDHKPVSLLSTNEDEGREISHAMLALYDACEERVKNSFFSMDEFKRTIKHHTLLLNIGLVFPAHMEALVEKILHHPSEFNRLIRRYHDLKEVVKALPCYADAFMLKALSRPDVFNTIFYLPYQLYDAVKILPSCSGSVMKALFYHPEIFIKFFKMSGALAKAVLVFPGYAQIFNQETSEAALQACHKRRASNAIKLFSVIHLLQLRKLPMELIFVILVMAADSVTHFEEEAKNDAQAIINHTTGMRGGRRFFAVQQSRQQNIVHSFTPMLPK